jgi:hypothetical protein
MSKQIRLWLGDGICQETGWCAEMLVDGQPDSDTVALFGTHILPTPFTGQASAEMVLASVAKRNPGVDVQIGGSR